MRRRLLARAAPCLVAAFVVTGCGEQEQPEISPQAAQVLAADVDAVTAAARAGDATALQEALKTLRAHVDAQQESGDLSSDRAARILAAGARVALDVGAPAPEVVVSPVPVPAPAGGSQDKGKGREKDEDGEEDHDD